MFKIKKRLLEHRASFRILDALDEFPLHKAAINNQFRSINFFKKNDSLKNLFKKKIILKKIKIVFYLFI